MFSDKTKFKSSSDASLSNKWNNPVWHEVQVFVLLSQWYIHTNREHCSRSGTGVKTCSIPNGLNTHLYHWEHCQWGVFQLVSLHFQPLFLLNVNNFCIISVLINGGSRGARDARPLPLGQNFFIFMQFSGQIGQIVCWRTPPVLRGWRPPLGNPGSTTANPGARPYQQLCAILYNPSASGLV